VGRQYLTGWAASSSTAHHPGAVEAWWGRPGRRCGPGEMVPGASPGRVLPGRSPGPLSSSWAT
jgi:hypothetical protein